MENREIELGWQVGPIYCKHLVYLAAIGHDVSICWIPESRPVALPVYHTHTHILKGKKNIWVVLFMTNPIYLLKRH